MNNKPCEIWAFPPINPYYLTTFLEIWIFYLTLIDTECAFFANMISKYDFSSLKLEYLVRSNIF